MSLRFFHIVFITMAAMLAAWVGARYVHIFYKSLQSGWDVLAWGVLFLAAAFGLAIYGVWYIRKTRGQSLI